MNKQEWNNSEDGSELIQFAQKKGVDKRKLVLVGGRCASLVKHLMKDKRSLKALEVYERYGLGEATEEELEEAANATLRVSIDAYAATRASDYTSYAAHAAYVAYVAYAAARAAYAAVNIAFRVSAVSVGYPSVANVVAANAAAYAASAVYATYGIYTAVYATYANYANYAKKQTLKECADIIRNVIKYEDLGEL